MLNLKKKRGDTETLKRYQKEMLGLELELLKLITSLRKVWWRAFSKTAFGRFSTMSEGLSFQKSVKTGRQIHSHKAATPLLNNNVTPLFILLALSDVSIEFSWFKKASTSEQCHYARG